MGRWKVGVAQALRLASFVVQQHGWGQTRRIIVVWRHDGDRRLGLPRLFLQAPLVP